MLHNWMHLFDDFIYDYNSGTPYALHA